jgi:hypothetical protein
MNDDYDFSYHEGKNNLMRYFKATYKPTREIINRHSNFFSNLKTVKEIYIYGHAISSVDFPYFEEIVRNTSDIVKWTVSFHDYEEYKRHKTTLVKLGIALENIRLIELVDIQNDNKQLKIEF